MTCIDIIFNMPGCFDVTRAKIFEGFQSSSNINDHYGHAQRFMIILRKSPLNIRPYSNSRIGFFGNTAEIALLVLPVTIKEDPSSPTIEILKKVDFCHIT